MTFTQNFDHKFLTTNNFLIKPYWKANIQGFNLDIIFPNLDLK